MFQVLTALDALDRHSFDRMDPTNSLDTLYAKIFSPPGTKEPSLAGSSCGNTNNTSNNGSNSTVSNNGSNGGDSARENRADYVSIFVVIICSVFSRDVLRSCILRQHGYPERSEIWTDPWFLCMEEKIIPWCFGHPACSGITILTELFLCLYLVCNTQKSRLMKDHWDRM
jgi:hypothetical protein